MVVENKETLANNATDSYNYYAEASSSTNQKYLKIAKTRCVLTCTRRRNRLSVSVFRHTPRSQLGDAVQRESRLQLSFANLYLQHTARQNDLFVNTIVLRASKGQS